MAHRSRKVTSHDRNGGTTLTKRPKAPLPGRLLRLVHRADHPSPATTPAKKLPLFEPYEDFDILATAGHNIG